MRDGFHPRLEALRGVAALMVAYFHVLVLVRVDEPWDQRIRSVLFMAGSGTIGVVIFFVLSGYVLAHSLDRHRGSIVAEAGRFLARRVLRIWPTMTVCLAACFVWVRFVHHPASFDAASAAYYDYWRDGASFRGLIRDALFQQTYYDPVTWTLAVEMLAGVLFVPLWWICRRSQVAAAVVTAAWAAWFLSTRNPPSTAYLYMLLLGLQADGLATLARRHLSGTGVKIGVALAFLGCGIAVRWPRATEAGTDLVVSLFAFLIVVLVVASHEHVRLGWLDHRVTRFMGRISYSFYLWHFPVNYVLMTWFLGMTSASLWQRWPNALPTLAGVVTVCCAIPVAWASWRFVELPSIALGRRRRGGLPTYAQGSGGQA